MDAAVVGLALVAVVGLTGLALWKWREYLSGHFAGGGGSSWSAWPEAGEEIPVSSMEDADTADHGNV